MSRFLLVLSLLAGMILSAASVASAQDTATDVDVAAIAETALGADPAALVTGLETPPDDANLPEGFINSPSDGSVNAEILEQLTGTTESIVEFEDTVGIVSHGYDTNPEIVPGVFSAGVISYIVADHEVTSEDLDSLEERARRNINVGTPAAATSTPEVESEGSVQRIELGGSDAMLLTVAANLGVVRGVIQIVVIPVGNTMVVGTMLVVDPSEVNADEVLPFAQDLTLAGVSHLGTVAEGVQ